MDLTVLYTSKDEQDMVFQYPDSTNLTTNTPILDCPAKFLFLAPIAEYLDVFPKFCKN